MASPIVVFAYKRPDKIINLLDRLSQNKLAKESDLFIFCDGYKSDKDREDVLKTQTTVSKYINDVLSPNSLFASVKIQLAEKNRGLATSVISGVTSVLSEYESVIVLEDDLEVSNDFLEFMNGALEYYKDDSRIGAISGYTYPVKALDGFGKDVYFLKKGDCWGWATTKNVWNNASWANISFNDYYGNMKNRRSFEKLECYFDQTMCYQLEGKMDSWAIRWVYHLYKNNMYTVYPTQTKVSNNGFDGSGTHCVKEEKYAANPSTPVNDAHMEFIPFFENKKLEKECAVYPRNNILKYLRDRLKINIKYILGKEL